MGLGTSAFVNLGTLLRTLTPQIQTITIATAALAGGAGKILTVGNLVGVSGTDFGATATRDQLVTWLNNNINKISSPPPTSIVASATNDIVITGNKTNLPIVSCNDSNFSVVLTQAGIAAYTGGGIVNSLQIFNPHASNFIYLHVTDDGIWPPLTAADGIPIGAASGGIGALWSPPDRGANVVSLNIDSIWIIASGTIASGIKVIVAGA